MYHRIAEPPVDPWGLSVSAANFGSQIDALRRRRRPMAMDEFVALLIAGRLPGDAVGITFDDGYVDNLHVAKPVLEAAGVPATVFVTSGWIGARRLFWWDELARLILLSAAPIDTDLPIGDERIALSAPARGPDEPRRGWRAWAPPGTDRERLYHDLWHRLHRLDAADRDAAIASLRDRLGGAPAAAGDLPMTRAQLSTLPSASIAVGGHARTHQPLTSMSIACQRAEIDDSRRVCAEATGRDIDGFAYPHGDADDDTRAAVRAAGYRWACSTHSATVPRTGYDLFDLPRVMAVDEDGAALLARLRAA
ncbi:polysaccharide deacetylase family protein [Sphingomonas sp. Leaf412]|uniref:polysaccharide deacetylase family protein n=1 Tax=Sphingomonas sp. Leaf412 TaxID=1736370 RepID=UPI001F47BB43|nr:polysaccharide deacetylase family protein [Sphingomonas sp. Leaf412]